MKLLTVASSKWVRLPLVIVVALAIQRSLFTDMRPLDAVADIMLLLVLAAGMVSGPRDGAICGFVIGIAYDPRMLAFHKGDLTIFRANHISMPRISVPIDTRMIGRWRSDLTPAQAEAFCRGAGDAMAEFGYLEAASAA